MIYYNFYNIFLISQILIMLNLFDHSYRFDVSDKLQVYHIQFRGSNALGTELIKINHPMLCTRPPKRNYKENFYLHLQVGSMYLLISYYSS